MDLTMLNGYLITAIVGICMCIGYLIKTSLDFIPNKYIPLIMAVIGIALNIFMAKGVSVDIILGGMLSGLASTGCHQALVNMKNKKVNVEDEQ